jgi:hypothetical protein
MMGEFFSPLGIKAKPKKYWPLSLLKILVSSWREIKNTYKSTL